MRITVYYATRNHAEIERIRTEHGLPRWMSVNGETDCELDDETVERLAVEIAKGNIQLRRKPEPELKTEISKAVIVRKAKKQPEQQIRPKRRQTVKKQNKAANQSQLNFEENESI